MGDSGAFFNGSFVVLILLILIFGIPAKNFNTVMGFVALCAITCVATVGISFILWLILMLFLESFFAWKMAFLIVCCLFTCVFEVAVYNCAQDDIADGRCGRWIAIRTLMLHFMVPVIFLVTWLFMPNFLWGIFH